MTVLTITRGTRAVNPVAEVTAPTAHPKAFLATDTGLKLELPYAPQEVEHDGLGPAFTLVARPGRRPLVLVDGVEARSHTFDLVIARPDYRESVQGILDALVAIRASGARCTVSLSALEQGLWRLTALRIRTLERQHGTNAPTRATASLTFSEVVDAVVNVGPLTGGAVVAPAPAGGAPAAAAPSAAPAPERYTVKRGDTLSALAVRFYGRADRYRDLAKASGIVNPNRITPGQVLTVPRP